MALKNWEKKIIADQLKIHPKPDKEIKRLDKMYGPGKWKI